MQKLRKPIAVIVRWDAVNYDVIMDTLANIFLNTHRRKLEVSANESHECLVQMKAMNV